MREGRRLCGLGESERHILYGLGGGRWEIILKNEEKYYFNKKNVYNK